MLHCGEGEGESQVPVSGLLDQVVIHLWCISDDDSYDGDKNDNVTYHELLQLVCHEVKEVLPRPGHQALTSTHRPDTRPPYMGIVQSQSQNKPFQEQFAVIGDIKEKYMESTDV